MSGQRRRPLTIAVRRGLHQLKALGSVNVDHWPEEFGDTPEVHKMMRDTERAMEWIDSLPDDGESDTTAEEPHT